MGKSKTHLWILEGQRKGKKMGKYYFRNILEKGTLIRRDILGNYRERYNKVWKEVTHLGLLNTLCILK